MTEEPRAGQWARLKEIVQRSAELVPEEDRTTWAHRTRVRLQGIAVLTILDVNTTLIRRFGGDLPPRWSPSSIPWSSTIEAAYPQIRAELVDYLGRTTIPQTAEVSGLDPDSEEGRHAAPADRGHWRSLMLECFGDTIEENARHFPATLAAIKSATGSTSIGFSALDPHSHIATHVGPNKGALRYQMPIVTPGPPASARIRIGPEMVPWDEGRPVVFDLSVNHEAWNDSDETRVLLMFEIPLPLRAPLRWCNRFAQWTYRFHPSYIRLPDRAREIAAVQNAAMAANGG